MQIQMKQRELELAVRDYIAKCGIARPIGTISFTASRGDDGVVTEVEILAVGVSIEEALAEASAEGATSPKKRASRKDKTVETEAETPSAEEASPIEVEEVTEDIVADLMSASTQARPPGKSLFG